MTNMPEPFTPPDCDLRGYDYMPLFGHRLFSSDLYTESSDAEFRAALRLWWAAWQQCPAGSLPNSERALAEYSGYGRDTKGWTKVSKMALHGFVECSDGRLYHPFLCGEAVTAYALRLKHDAKRERDRERLQAWREAQKKRAVEGDGSDGQTCSETPDETRFDTPKETDGEAHFVAGRQDKTRQDKEVPSLRSGRTQGTRLPDGWWPSADDMTFAVNLGLNLTATAEKFRDYWHGKPGKEGRKQDWPATWRNWCRREAEHAASRLAPMQARPNANDGRRAAAFPEFFQQ